MKNQKQCIKKCALRLLRVPLDIFVQLTPCYYNFISSEIISELPGINKNNEVTINRIPITNRKITILTKRDTSFFSVPIIRRTTPIKSNKK